jgi:hypothetical protein
LWTRSVIGIVFCLVGAVWIAQGTGVLHGSSMSGQGQWTAIGSVLVLLGAALLVWAWRISVRRAATPEGGEPR